MGASSWPRRPLRPRVLRDGTGLRILGPFLVINEAIAASAMLQGMALPQNLLDLLPLLHPP
jgi:hypothetical protein